MGAAFKLAQESAGTEGTRATLLRRRLWQGLSALGGVLRNGTEANSVPQILNASFADVEGESLLAAVWPHIAVSAGAACTSAVQEPSYVLRALGRDDRLAESSLRFSLGRFTEERDIDVAVAAVAEALSRLRKIGGA
jgi:cysteine desulfurase